MKEIRIGIKYNLLKNKERSFKEKKKAPRQIGIRSKKTKSTPSLSLMPLCLTPNKVTPLLEIPGIKPIDSKKPIEIALLKLNVWFLFFMLLDIKRIMLVIIRDIPTPKVFKNTFSILSFSNIPKIPAGKEDKIR